MGLFGSSRASKLGSAIGIDDLRDQAEAQGYTSPAGPSGNSALRGIAGTIGDFLLQRAGMQPIYGPQMLYKQRQALEEAQWTRRQNSELAQRKAMYDYELAHPKPVNNDTIADYNFRVQTLGKRAADEWLRSQGDPIVTIPLPGDRIYSGPRSGLGAALSGYGAPQPQAGAVVDDPRKTGGAGSPAPRPFP